MSHDQDSDFLLVFIKYELDQLTCTANTYNDPCDLKASNNKVAGSFHGHLHCTCNQGKQSSCNYGYVGLGNIHSMLQC